MPKNPHSKAARKALQDRLDQAYLLMAASKPLPQLLLDALAATNASLLADTIDDLTAVAFRDHISRVALDALTQATTPPDPP